MVYAPLSGDEIADLNDRLIGLQQIKDQEKEQYESELQKLRTDYQEMKDQLTSDNMILGIKTECIKNVYNKILGPTA